MTNEPAVVRIQDHEGNFVELKWDDSDDALDFFDFMADMFGERSPRDGCEINLSGGAFSCHTKVFK